ncbi:hypothetical protein ACQPX6_28450 [Actinomycetospora sp. CA-101289]|uniref:hypothetical protein n=1 Tax=Actinomycetospora sp. CA-101289 TaxID=3239893 RepID=UPI003D9844FA
MTGLNTSWRVTADVLDVGAEASTALATLTATALTALLAPPNHTTLTGVPDLAGGLDRHPSRPGEDILAMPSRVPTRPPRRPGPTRERGAETVAAIVLHAAALAVGAAAALASPVQTTVRVATWPLRAATTDPDPVPDPVRAAAHVTDLAAARIERWAHPSTTPVATSTPPDRAPGGLTVAALGAVAGTVQRVRRNAR